MPPTFPKTIRGRKLCLTADLLKLIDEHTHTYLSTCTKAVHFPNIINEFSVTNVNETKLLLVKIMISAGPGCVRTLRRWQTYS